MKIDEMNIVITGANGVLASCLLEYFSNRAAFVVGTVRQLVETSRPKNNEAIIEIIASLFFGLDVSTSCLTVPTTSRNV